MGLRDAELIPEGFDLLPVLFLAARVQLDILLRYAKKNIAKVKDCSKNKLT